jgi:hypothetical protein
MDYELAKQLRDAGFPNSMPSFAPKHLGDIRIPTLSELIAACGDSLNYMRRMTIRTGETEISDGWEVCQSVDKGETARLIQEFSLEEAVAKLWLSLNKRD